MKTIAGSNNRFYASIDGDPIGADVIEYTKQKCWLLLHSVSADRRAFGVVFTYIVGGITTNTPEVRYYTDSVGAVTVSIRDMMAHIAGLGGASVQISIYMYQTPSSTAIYDTAVFSSVVILDGISYTQLGAPRNKDFNVEDALAPNLILPPNVIIEPPVDVAHGFTFESNYTMIDSTATWTGPGAPSNSLANDHQCKPDMDAFTLTTTAGETKTWTVQRSGYCDDILEVKWMSLTGVMRHHYFPIVSFIRGNGDEVEVETHYDGYDLRKGNFTAVRCRLTGLTAWGYYYYMDLINASRLEAVVFGNGYITGDGSCAAAVKAESMETPTGPGFFMFEFVCNLKQFEI